MGAKEEDVAQQSGEHILKRIGNIDGIELYDCILSKDNLMQAIDNAAKDHAHDPQVINMRENKEDHAYYIWQELSQGTFTFSKFRSRTIFERGKSRHLCYTVTFPDRVVQHAVLQIVAPILLGTSIRDSYAAQKGKGTHMCSMQVRKDIFSDPEGTRYYLKEDISKYFDNVRPDILFKLIKKKIKDRRTLDILHTFIFDTPGRKGLPIGMYSSQIFSSFMLTYFDHWVKEDLGVRYYYRYMDDMVFLSDNKTTLRRIHKVVEDKLRKEYGLRIKGNWRIAPVRTGLDFVGFVHWPTHVTLRKRNKLAYKRVCNGILRNLRKHIPITAHMLASARSYDGMATWCDSKRLRYLNFGRVVRAIRGPSS